jgi:hypothetical protein
MRSISKTLVPFAHVALVFGAATLPAHAASSASSASSDGVSASVGSISTSFEKSSDSSSQAKPVAAGDYKVIEVAAAPARPGTVRLTLQAVADASAEGEFYLYLPQEAAAQGGVAAGQVVTARARAYGLEFAQAGTKEAFFLVLDDAWYRELQTKVVTL